MVKHPVTQVSLCTDTGAKEAYTPQKTPCYDQKNDHQHGHTDFVHQEAGIEDCLHTVHGHIAGVNTVDDHLVQLRDLQLQIVHNDQGNQTNQ